MTARDDYDRAMSNIRRGFTKRVGGQKYENMATAAYQAMVVSGEESPIKRKYVVGKAHKQVQR